MAKTVDLMASMDACVDLAQSLRTKGTPTADNLRGAVVAIDRSDDTVIGVVITHTRNDHWLIYCPDAPKNSQRITLHRRDLLWIE